MTANELKYTYMEEAMSILDNEELMRKALSLLRNLKEKTFSPAKRSEREVLEEAFQSVKDLKAGKITSRPLEDLLNGRPSYTDQERAEGRKRAAEAIRARCSHYAPLMGVSYGTITSREQKTRWGSCSAKGNLNFNWKLVLMPPEILDYVVVHELAHRLQMNHSAAFWAEVGKILPDYRERRQWLKVNGQKY